MATRHLAWPQHLAPMMNTLGFNLAHNADRTKTLGGVTYARDYWTRSKEVYQAIFQPRRDNDHEVELCLDITERMHGVAVPVWIAEPLPRHHRRRLCGIGDGSTLAFAVPYWGLASAPHIMIGSSEQTVAEYTPYANMLTDDQAYMLESITGLTALGSGSISRDDAQAYYSRYSCKYSQVTTESNYGLKTTQQSVTVAVDYTGVMWVAGGIPSARAIITWYDATTAIGVTNGTSTPVGDEWTAIEVTGTAPSGALYAELRGECNASSDEDFWADCLSFGPLESADWWPPSLSPGVVRLSTGPAVDDRVESTGTGQSLVRCAAAKNQIGRSVDSIGNITIPRITFEELWENG